MKNLIMFVVVGVIVYFVFFNSPFKKDFYFNGEEYAHVMAKTQGEATNHIYTINGEDSKYARTFIQIIEVSEKIHKEEWPYRLKSILNRYKLKPFKPREFEYTGTTEIQSLFVNSFATPIHIKDNDHFILYVQSTGNEKNKLSPSEKKDILTELKNLDSVFN